MAISKEVDYANIDELFLDPSNPRLGRRNTVKNLPQDQLLEIMRGWTLEELAESYLVNSGFWTHEALLVVKENLYDAASESLVVVEGNRRLAALKLLSATVNGTFESKKWRGIIDNQQIPTDLFSRVPYILVDERDEIQAFLGFRHVTGIKEWDSDEKAGFIAGLIEKEDLSYEDVMRKIGSKTPTVRRLYIAYRLLLQIEDVLGEDFDPEWAENRFSLLYSTLNTEGAREYLNVDLQATPEEAFAPVPPTRHQELKNFSKWLFGTDTVEPLVTDTRQVVKFGRALESSEARQYLERSRNPNLEVAYRRSGGDAAEVIASVEEAAENVELALSRAHLFKNNTDLQLAVKRLGRDMQQLFNLFPTVYTELLEEEV